MPRITMRERYEKYNRGHHGSVPINNLDHAGVRDTLQDLLLGEERGHHVISLGPPHYGKASISTAFTGVLERASVVVPESSGLWLYSLTAGPILHRVPGPDIAKSLLDLAVQHDLQVVLVGSSEERRLQAIENLRGDNPCLKIDQVAGSYSFSDQEQRNCVLVQLLEMRADVAIVAGIDQEVLPVIDQWIQQGDPDRLPRVIGNFGQAIDLWAGKQDHPLARTFGVEWLARLMTESKTRRERYKGDLGLFAKVIILNATIPRNRPRI